MNKKEHLCRHQAEPYHLLYRVSWLESLFSKDTNGSPMPPILAKKKNRSPFSSRLNYSWIDCCSSWKAPFSPHTQVTKQKHFAKHTHMSFDSALNPVYVTGRLWWRSGDSASAPGELATSTRIMAVVLTGHTGYGGHHHRTVIKPARRVLFQPQHWNFTSNNNFLTSTRCTFSSTSLSATSSSWWISKAAVNPRCPDSREMIKPTRWSGVAVMSSVYSDS